MTVAFGVGLIFFIFPNFSNFEFATEGVSAFLHELGNLQCVHSGAARYKIPFDFSKGHKS